MRKWCNRSNSITEQYKDTPIILAFIFEVHQNLIFFEFRKQHNTIESNVAMNILLDKKISY